MVTTRARSAGPRAPRHWSNQGRRSGGGFFFGFFTNDQLAVGIETSDSGPCGSLQRSERVTQLDLLARPPLLVLTLQVGKVQASAA
jgi:hypothetical protein